ALDLNAPETVVARREGGVPAAVVELDPLADAVGAAAENHDLLPRRRIRLAFLLVGAVEVRRERLALRRARVDPLVGGPQPLVDARRAHRLFVGAEHAPELPVAEARAVERSHQVRRDPAQADERRLVLEIDQLLELREEPAIDLRE